MGGGEGMGKASRDKGARAEREIVASHAELGVKAERVPLSGAARYYQAATMMHLCSPGAFGLRGMLRMITRLFYAALVAYAFLQPQQSAAFVYPKNGSGTSDQRWCSSGLYSNQIIYGSDKLFVLPNVGISFEFCIDRAMFAHHYLKLSLGAVQSGAVMPNNLDIFGEAIVRKIEIGGFQNIPLNECRGDDVRYFCRRFVTLWINLPDPREKRFQLTSDERIKFGYNIIQRTACNYCGFRDLPRIKRPVELADDTSRRPDDIIGDMNLTSEPTIKPLSPALRRALFGICGDDAERFSPENKNNSICAGTIGDEKSQNQRERTGIQK
jgi:hypothetical protein